MVSVPRRQWILIAGGLLYAAAGLTASLVWFPIGDLDVESDFYAELGPAAQRIAAGDLDVRHHPYKGPLQPLLTAALHRVLWPVGVGWYRCAVVLSLASGCSRSAPRIGSRARSPAKAWPSRRWR